MCCCPSSTKLPMGCPSGLYAAPWLTEGSRRKPEWSQTWTPGEEERRHTRQSAIIPAAAQSRWAVHQPHTHTYTPFSNVCINRTREGYVNITAQRHSMMSISWLASLVLGSGERSRNHAVVLMLSLKLCVKIYIYIHVLVFSSIKTPLLHDLSISFNSFVLESSQLQHSEKQYQAISNSKTREFHLCFWCKFMNAYANRFLMYHNTKRNGETLPNYCKVLLWPISIEIC